MTNKLPFIGEKFHLFSSKVIILREVNTKTSRWPTFTQNIDEDRLAQVYDGLWYYFSTSLYSFATPAVSPAFNGPLSARGDVVAAASLLLTLDRRLDAFAALNIDEDRLAQVYDGLWYYFSTSFYSFATPADSPVFSGPLSALVDVYAVASRLTSSCERVNGSTSGVLNVHLTPTSGAAELLCSA